MFTRREKHNRREKDTKQTELQHQEITNPGDLESSVNQTCMSLKLEHLEERAKEKAGVQTLVCSLLYQKHVDVLARSVCDSGVRSMKLASEQKQGRQQVIKKATLPTWTLSDCFIFKLNSSLPCENYCTKLYSALLGQHTGNNKQRDSFELRL